MRYHEKTIDGVNIQVASFLPTDGVVEEIHLMLHVIDTDENLEGQCRRLVIAVFKQMDELCGGHPVAVFGRCFLSDISNGEEVASHILSEHLSCPISYAGQPPLDGSKVALWLQLQSEGVIGDDGWMYCEHNGYRHYHTVNVGEGNSSSYKQTMVMLLSQKEELAKRHGDFLHHCVRTWFIVRDIDVNYSGVVKARREFFFRNGLTPHSHFIASTGIGGSSCRPTTKVLLDAHYIVGMAEGQIHYLYAKSHLNPTYEYGVTFERGMYMDYGDRREVYISGTASIDNKGNILHAGDVVRQTERACENVAALLEEADCHFDDVAQMIVYLRDVADYPRVKALFEEKFPDIPKQIVLAPVCRPGWLVELECIAIKKADNQRYKDY
jgi:enamine deaminase RidA (YjgF/YER057c/UK114 family)